MASGLPHAFDAFANTDESRRIIQQTIAFWKSNLETVPQPAPDPNSGREVLSAIYGNETQRAADLLQKYLATNPNDTIALNNYGRILVDLRRFDEASAAYEKALALGSTEPGLYVGLGQFRLQQRRYAEATQLLSKAIEMGARNSLTYGQLGFAQLSINKNEDAIKSYERSFEMGIPPGANTRGVAYYNMACAYVRLKDTDKAFEMLGKAVDEGFSNRATLETDTDLTLLKSDPRFGQLLGRLPKAPQ